MGQWPEFVRLMLHKPIFRSWTGTKEFEMKTCWNSLQLQILRPLKAAASDGAEQDVGLLQAASLEGTPQ